MSIRYELAEFYDDVVDRSQDFGFQVADQTRRGLCQLWQNLPGALIPNPGDAFRRGALSALCQDFTPPPPPAPSFPGGQCPVSYRLTFRRAGVQISTGNEFDQTLESQIITGPISGNQYRQDGNNRILFVTDGNGQEVTLTFANSVTNNITFLGVLFATRLDGQPDNCGDPPPQFPGDSIVEEGDTIFEGDTIVEGDRTQSISIDFSPTFEDEVCIGQFVFCADVEGNRVTLDAGGVTINLPGTGGGNSDGGGGGDSETITNIDNRTTIIQQTQEQCCAEIISAISSFRNRATELFNEGELRDACIVGLIRNATETVPRLEAASSVRASGVSGMLGLTRYVQPLSGDSCFLIIEIGVTESFRGRLYNLREESADVEGGFGHVELCFSDGTTRPPSEAGLRVIYSLRTLVWFPYISSGNQIRLSLKPGLSYTVTDPGFRWRPKGLPTCEEVIDPLG